MTITTNRHAVAAMLALTALLPATQAQAQYNSDAVAIDARAEIVPLESPAKLALVQGMDFGTLAFPGEMHDCVYTLDPRPGYAAMSAGVENNMSMGPGSCAFSGSVQPAEVSLTCGEGVSLAMSISMAADPQATEARILLSDGVIAYGEGMDNDALSKLAEGSTSVELACSGENMLALGAQVRVNDYALAYSGVLGTYTLGITY